jgi:hypothetical protein
LQAVRRTSLGQTEADSKRMRIGPGPRMGLDGLFIAGRSRGDPSRSAGNDRVAAPQSGHLPVVVVLQEPAQRLVADDVFQPETLKRLGRR